MPLIKVQCVNMMNICKLEVSKVDVGSGCEGESQRGEKKNLGRKSSGLMQSMVINSCLFYEANKPTCTSWVSLCRQAVFILYVQYINRSKVHLYGLNVPLGWMCTACGDITHTEGMLATALRLVGFRIILSRVPTMSLNRGRTFRSFCQQSNINWCKVLGQSIGGGRR